VGIYVSERGGMRFVHLCFRMRILSSKIFVYLYKVVVLHPRRSRKRTRERSASIVDWPEFGIARGIHCTFQYILEAGCRVKPPEFPSRRLTGKKCQRK